MQLDPTMAPLKNNYFTDCIIFISNTENGFAKAALFVSKVSVSNSYTHLENLLDWTADIFFVATHGKSEPFDSDEHGKATCRCHGIVFITWVNHFFFAFAV